MGGLQPWLVRGLVLLGPADCCISKAVMVELPCVEGVLSAVSQGPA